MLALVLALALSGVVVPSTRGSALPSDEPDPCGALVELRLPGGKFACTHGPDPAPEGVDQSVPFDPASARTGLILTDPLTGPVTAAAGSSGVRCYGDGRSGNRVQAVYARPAGHPDRYTEVLPFIRQWANDIDAVFEASAKKAGGTRHVRFVTSPRCEVVVENVVLSNFGDDDLTSTMAEMAMLGYDQPDRRYLVWMDSTELCGIAAYYEDDRPGGDNLNNGSPQSVGLVARVDSGCWGYGSQGESVEAHELMHSLGSVLPTAPNATLLGHCTDESDRMCYPDLAVTITDDVCNPNDEAVFDCGGDDYFNPAPAPGSYLASHWNTANSGFITELDTAIPALIEGGGPQPEGDLDQGDTPGPPGESTGLAFSVRLTVPPEETVRVSYATADGTAQAGSDFGATAGVLEFGPGERQKTVTVPVHGDFVDEADEDFSLRLFDPVGVMVVGPPGRGVIVDDDPKGQGYWLVATDGGIFSYADAAFFGSAGGVRLNQPIVGVAPTPSGQGYWLVARDGGIFSFGDAGFFGSTGDIRLNQPIVGMAGTPSGRGYWLVAADGGVFSFGDARPLGSVADQPLPAPIVALAPTPSGAGYWLAGRNGRVFEFGDASHFGATPRLNQPIVGAASTPGARGLWLVAADGGIFGFGAAGFVGSTGGLRLNQPIVGLAATPSGGGYWLVARDGGIFAFGDAGFWGSTGNLRLNRPVVGVASRP